jgi:hypothetical protein
MFHHITKNQKLSKSFSRKKERLPLFLEMAYILIFYFKEFKNGRFSIYWRKKSAPLGERGKNR